MRCAIIGFVTGVAVLQNQPTLPQHPALALAGTLVLAAIAATLAFRRKRAQDTCGAPAAHAATAVMAACGAAVFGFFWAAFVAEQALGPALAKADEGRDFELVGTIDSLPNRFEGGMRFNFAVESSQPAAPPRIALSWYAGYRGTVAPLPDLQPGQRWRLKARLQRPHGNANPYGFDYELWLLEQGVRATGYVRLEGDNARQQDFVPTLHNAVERARSALRDRISTALQGREYAGVIVALVIGDQRAIPQSDWQVFNRTGISHLISISGLHITMVAGMVALAASWLWRRSFFVPGAALPLRLPAQKFAALAGMLAALAYVALAGFGVPAQRTLYMLAVIAVALWFDRLTGITHVLALAAGLAVLLDPWAVMWPGFWLSFGAVAIILYASLGRTEGHVQESAPDGGRPRRPPKTAMERLMHVLHTAGNTQYAVTIGLVPLTMLLFAQFSLVSPVANAIAIPVVSLLVTPLALAGSMLPEPLCSPMLLAAHELVRLLASLLEWLSASPLAVWIAPTPPWWQFAWAMFGTCWLLAPRGWPVRWLGLATWVPLLAATPSHPPHGALRVTAFDVGQGMALLVETAQHRLLYDTGPTYAPDSNGGNRVIVPYLRARGIEALDGTIVTHSDTDHSGGALAVLASIRNGWLISSLPAGHPVVRAARHHERCAAGQHWQWDGIDFDILHPTAESYADSTLKPNARSCTLRIRAPGGTVLLAADIEARQEAELAARNGASLRADVLLVPHHGSGTSSTPGFLQTVQPHYAIYQLGYRNRYHHPKADVVERYSQIGAAQYRTDDSGAITIDVAEAVKLYGYRVERPRYWYGR